MIQNDNGQDYGQDYGQDNGQDNVTSLAGGGAQDCVGAGVDLKAPSAGPRRVPVVATGNVAPGGDCELVVYTAGGAHQGAERAGLQAAAVV